MARRTGSALHASTARLAAFSRELGTRSASVTRLVEAPPTSENDDALLREALDELQRHHDELVVAEEELRQQLDELHRASACVDAERERFRSLFENAPDAYLVTDLQGVVVEANVAAGELLAVPRAAMLRGRPLLVAIDPVDRRRLFDFVETMRRSERGALELLVRPRGAAEPVAVAISCASTERGTRLLWTLRSTRAASPSEGTPSGVGELAAARARIVELEQALRLEKQARAHLEAVDASKDRFVAMVAHDLRSPIQAVLGWAQMLRREVLTGETRERALATIERNARTQIKLVADLLDLSRIASEKLRLELGALDLAVIARRAVEAASPQARDVGVELRLEAAAEPLPVFVDRARMDQVVANLLANALKFTPTGGSVTVAVACDGANAVLRVVDDGAGVAEEELPRLFECFHQEDEVDAHSGLGHGLGLGLFIAKQMVELHGGLIEAASDGFGKGATFTVRLPLREGATELASSDRILVDPGPTLERRHVLVVDDEPDARELLGVILAERGATVSTASDVASALGVVTERAVDVVVCDLDLNGEDGRDLVSRVHALRSSVPAIALSGFATERRAEEALRAGFALHLTKPVDTARLVEAICAVLSAGED